MLKKKQEQKTIVEELIEDLKRQMDVVEADSPEYAAMMKQLAELYKIKDPNARDRTTLRDWIPVIASLSGITLIIVYESFGHSFTSKAATFIRKP
jgi:hypothetical protein